MALRQARQGDNRAFAEIVREHQAMVFSIGWHYLADRALAEDLVQEVFLRLYQNLVAIESPAHLVRWLRRVTVHRCVDHSRRSYFRRESPLEETCEIAVRSSPADSFLSERLRQSLELGEIAELLDMPLNTVKSTLHRALENLRGKMTRKLKEARYAFL